MATAVDVTSGNKAETSLNFFISSRVSTTLFVTVYLRVLDVQATAVGLILIKQRNLGLILSISSVYSELKMPLMKNFKSVDNNLIKPL